MKTNILFVILTTGVLIAGCSSFSKSNIFKSFSLQSIASKTAYKNIDCSKGADGDAIEVEGSAVGAGGTSSARPSTIRCEIIERENKEFSETEFFDALLSEVEKEIKASGGTMARKGRPSINNFVVDYEVRRRQGKISVSGKRDGSSYELTSEISEKTK